MNKYKYLFKNIGLMTISNFGSKILSFLLVPLYTNVLSTEDYGIYDFYVITIYLLIPILSLNIIEAVLRFSLDSKKDKAKIFTIGFYKCIVAVCICSILIIINMILNIVDVLNKYPLFFILYFTLSLFSDLILQYTRGLERLKDVAISGIISSITILCFNVLLLVVFNWKLEGFFIANCLSFFSVIIFLSLRIKIWQSILLKSDLKMIKKEMTSYSTPMILNSIGWWINNVANKYIVIFLCGIAANGIFSVAYRIPSILVLFQTIFNQAWTVSAVKEFDKNNSSFYLNIYNAYNMGMVIVCSILILFNKTIAYILFANDFYLAWQYAPFLILAVVFNSLATLLGGIFSAAKETKKCAKTTMIGSVANIALGLILVYQIGIMGAAISTMISQMIVWLTRLKETKKIIQFDINIKLHIISYIILLIQVVIILFIENMWLMTIIEFSFFILIIILYKDNLLYYVKTLVFKKKNKEGEGI